MASQKSTAPGPAMARDPQRERGKRRVAALLDAAAVVFAEKPYDAATMTEIAARANTAIGSLYQFFPNKESIADALLARYGARLHTSLQAIEDRAATLDSDAIADALIALVLDLRLDRASAVALIDVRDTGGLGRSSIREDMRRRIAAILLAGAVALRPDKAAAMARVLQQVMKSIPDLALDADATGADLLGEVRVMLRLYIAQGRNATTADRVG